MGVTVERSGRDVFAKFRDMGKLAKVAADILADECRNECPVDILADECRNECPVDTGDLRSSIHVEDGQDSATVAIGGGKVDYATFVIWGTSKNPPNNFVARAMVKASRRIRESIKAMK